jgi:hypothetical protein
MNADCTTGPMVRPLPTKPAGRAPRHAARECVIWSLLAAALFGPAPAAARQVPPREPLAALMFPGISAFAWVGDDKLVAICRQQYRRADVQWIRLSTDLKPEYLSIPGDVRRFAFSRNPAISVSPDGRWLVGGDVRGPRVIDLTTNESQGWPGDARNGHWLKDGTGWIEVSPVRSSGDPDAQERRERELNARSMEMRVFELFGDEWTNIPAHRSLFTIGFHASVLGATAKDELLIASQKVPSRTDVTLSKLRAGRSARLSQLLSVRCPSGGEIADIALSPDRRSVAVLSVSSLSTDRLKSLPEPFRRSLKAAPAGDGYLIEITVLSLDGSASRPIHLRPVYDGPPPFGVETLSGAAERPRGLQWRPDGKVLGYLASEQLILVGVPEP